MRFSLAAAVAALHGAVAIPAPVSYDVDTVLHFGNAPAGKQIAGGRELRILPVGDSITVGYLSDQGGDGDGYRRKLRDDLSSKSGCSIFYRHILMLNFQRTR